MTTPAVAAHEAGHLMGLPDQYTTSIDPKLGRVTTPLPGAQGNIMGSLSGKPSEGDIVQILKQFPPNSSVTPAAGGWSAGGGGNQSPSQVSRK